MDIYTLFGKRIQTLRKAKGFTQDQFSELIDISPNYLSDIERGKSFPRLDKLVVIMNTLECSADDVFQDIINYGYKVKSSKLTERLDALSPKEREKALAILDAYIK